MRCDQDFFKDDDASHSESVKIGRCNQPAVPRISDAHDGHVPRTEPDECRGHRSPHSAPSLVQIYRKHNSAFRNGTPGYIFKSSDIFAIPNRDGLI